MRKRSLAVLVLVVTGLWAPPGQAFRLTLEQAISQALELSEELRLGQIETHLADLAVQEAAGRRLPQLEFTSQYLFTSEVMSLDQAPVSLNLGTTSVVIPGKQMSFGDNYTLDFKLQVTQPLFTGFRLRHAQRAARHAVEQKQAEVARLHLQMKYQAEQTYINAQKSAAMRSVMQLRIDILQRHLEDVRRRWRQGVVPAEMVARAEFGMVQARLKQQEAENAYRLAEAALRELLNLPQEGEELELDSLELSPAEMAAQDEEYAFAHRPEFQVLAAQQAAVSERIGLESAAYYPALAAFGAVDYGRPGIDKLANEWMLYETAGVSLNWTLWDWKIRRSKVEQAAAAERQIEESRSVLRSRVRLERRSAQLALENARRRLEVARQGSELSQEVLQWVHTKYAQGTATEKEYQEAQDDLTASQTEYLVALADCRLAQAALNYALGHN